MALAAPPFETQAISRRWKGSDIYQYEVSLRRWDGARFAELEPPLTVILPQQGKRKHQARFDNLRHGQRYRVEVVAKGNPGGTAPKTILNSEVPCWAEFDLRGLQDVESVRTQSLSVSLDPVPFSGTLALDPRNVPGPVRRFAVTLRDAASGATRASGAFTRNQKMTFSNLRTGTSYQVALTAYRANGQVYRSLTSEVVRFDPAAGELEQHRTLPIAF